MNPIQLIKNDHRTVKSLFRKFERASQSSEKQRIGQEIIEELSVHATVEEELVYPVLRADKRIEDAVLNAMEEHHAVKLTLRELDKMKATDERYDAKMHVVMESIENHIEVEETDLLPRLEKLLDTEQSNKLAQRIVAMKNLAPNHPHPKAPDTPPGGFVAGMVAKVLDVGKDVVRGVTSPDKARGHRRVRARAKSMTSKVASGRSRSAGRRSRA
jgi:hemerythrin superfamily protein